MGPYGQDIPFAVAIFIIIEVLFLVAAFVEWKYAQEGHPYREDL